MMRIYSNPKNLKRKHLLGPFIKSLRLSIDLTQKDISDATGFSIQTISKFENQKSSPDTYATNEITRFVLKQAEDTGINVTEAFEDFCEAIEDYASDVPQMLQ